MTPLTVWNESNSQICFNLGADKDENNAHRLELGPPALLTLGSHAIHPSNREAHGAPGLALGNAMKRLCAIACSALTGASLWAGGFGVGVQTSFDLTDNSAIAPRVEYLRFTDSSTVGGPFGNPIDLSATVNCFSLGADYDYYLGGETGKGFYLLGGLGVATASIEVSGSGAGSSASTTKRQTVVYPEAGVGYQITPHLGVELLYKALRFSDVTVAVAGEPVGYSFTGSVQASLVLRF